MKQIQSDFYPLLVLFVDRKFQRWHCVATLVKFSLTSTVCLHVYFFLSLVAISDAFKDQVIQKKASAVILNKTEEKIQTAHTTYMWDQDDAYWKTNIVSMNNVFLLNSRWTWLQNLKSRFRTLQIHFSIHSFFCRFKRLNACLPSFPSCFLFSEMFVWI